MNTKQQLGLKELWRRVGKLEPGRHDITRMTSPVTVLLRCTCGWSASASKAQNAFAREGRLFSEERRHAQEIISAHPVEG